MNHLAVALVLCALPALAQPPGRWELGILYDEQSPRSQSVMSTFSYTGGQRQMSWKADPAKSRALGLRGAFRVAEAAGAKIHLTATFRAKADATVRYSNSFVVTGPYPSSGSYSLDAGRFGEEYAALGGRASWHRVVDFGLGLEIRKEHLSATTVVDAVYANYTRPWATAHLAYPFRVSGLRSFAGFEIGLPLAQKSKPNPDQEVQTQADEDVYSREWIRSYAPKFQIALSAGIRF